MPPQPKSASTRVASPGGKKKKKKKVPRPGGPSAEAAALLAEALARTTVAPAAASMPSAVTAANLFDTAYDAARQNDFDNTLKVLEDIRGSDALLQALLGGLLQAQSDGSEGFTILHQAAWHGDARAVRELLRLGEQFHVIVPDDASPGTTLEVELPAADAAQTPRESPSFHRTASGRYMMHLPVSLSSCPWDYNPLLSQ